MKNNYFRNTIHLKKGVSKTFTIFFLTIESCFGFNFGFIQSVNNEFKWLLKLIRYVAFICMSIILASILPRLDNEYNIYYIFDLIYYFTFGVISLMYKYTYYNFLTQIINISDDISNRIQIYFIIYTFICIVGKIVYLFVICFVYISCYYSILPEFAYGIPSYALDSIPISAAIIFYYIYNSVAKLSKACDKLSKSTNADELLKKYTAIADCYDQVKPLYSAMIFLQVTTNIPKLMITIYYAISFLKTSPHWTSLLSQVIFVCQLILQFCIPSFIGELIDSEMESFKLVLNNQLISKKDTKSATSILRLLRYIDARPLKHRVCRLMTIDLTLPISVFSFCITYMIVVIQLTHLV